MSYNYCDLTVTYRKDVGRYMYVNPCGFFNPTKSIEGP